MVTWFLTTFVLRKCMKYKDRLVSNCELLFYDTERLEKHSPTLRVLAIKK